MDIEGYYIYKYTIYIIYYAHPYIHSSSCYSLSFEDEREIKIKVLSNFRPNPGVLSHTETKKIIKYFPLGCGPNARILLTLAE